MTNKERIEELEREVVDLRKLILRLEIDVRSLNARPWPFNPFRPEPWRVPDPPPYKWVPGQKPWPERIFCANDDVVQNQHESEQQ